MVIFSIVYASTATATVTATTANIITGSPALHYLRRPLLDVHLHVLGSIVTIPIFALSPPPNSYYSLHLRLRFIFKLSSPVFSNAYVLC